MSSKVHWFRRKYTNKKGDYIIDNLSTNLLTNRHFLVAMQKSSKNHRMDPLKEFDPVLLGWAVGILIVG